jgi:hypothetical protein
MYARRTAEELQSLEVRIGLGRSPPPARQTQWSILDQFGSSGTAIPAADCTGRVARVIELDPLYIDPTIHRREQITGIAVRHAEFGLAFAEPAAKRATTAPGLFDTFQIDLSQES